jgi:hypothetical protein
MYRTRLTNKSNGASIEELAHHIYDQNNVLLSLEKS